MIAAVARTAATALRRDRAALALSFLLPVAFFTIFALVFGGRSETPRIRVAVADADHSRASEALLRALSAEGIELQPRPTAAAAEAAVKAGEAPVALVVPPGFERGAAGEEARPAALELLADPADPVASQLVGGLVQKALSTALPDLAVARGARLMDAVVGGFTPAQRARVDGVVQLLRDRDPATAGATGEDPGLLAPLARRDVVGAEKPRPMISFYAAAIGVMFLLFTASAAAGSLLEEAESGALDRVLSSRVTMGTLLGGKLLYCTLLAFAQLAVMFIFAATVFHLELAPHLAGVAVMGLATSFAVAAFGMLLAALCRTRAQLGGLSTLLVLVMSALGGSMFPRSLMPAAMQQAGRFTLNAWAIDGFTKVLWRDEPVLHLWPEVAVLVGSGVVLFAVARWAARRWEYA
jgi:ABC-2 type transport system permease protein